MLLPLIWPGMGLLIGFIAYLARIQPTIWSRSKRLDLFSYLVIGALVAFCSGWLGVFLFGRLFSIATALWITIAAVVILPWIVGRIQASRKRQQSVI
ncbi:MAG: hypothetical protein H0V70_03995 [Ktedonobacteraceae bacterium]|nr:hypothetical protein [Ktedonobacteraceae bacterium]